MDQPENRWDGLAIGLILFVATACMLVIAMAVTVRIARWITGI